MRTKGDWMLLLAAIIGGAGFIGVKYLLDWGYTPYQVIFGRFFIASITLSLIYCKHYPKISKREWKMGGILGVLMVATFFFLTFGLQLTTPSVNAFMGNTPAIIVPFICWAAFRQKPDRRCFVAAFLTTIGVAMLSVTKDFQLDMGAIISFGGSVAFALQMTFMSRALKDCDSVHIALVEHLAVVVVAFVIVLISSEPVPALIMPSVVNFLVVGVPCTALYFLLQSIGQRYTSANKTALIITTEAIFAAIFSFWLYGEKMQLQGLFGCALIFISVVLAEKPQKSVDTANKIQ